MADVARRCRDAGQRLRAGMAITIEPMIAQFEHTVVVTKTGAEVMTALS